MEGTPPSFHNLDDTPVQTAIHTPCQILLETAAAAWVDLVPQSYPHVVVSIFFRVPRPAHPAVCGREMAYSRFD